MKQILQSIDGGKLSVSEVPPPIARPGYVVVANDYSLISAGTEKAVRRLASLSLLGKARERPDQVRRVLEKIRHEGLGATITQVRAKLGEPMPLGYSSAGVVVACGAGVQEFKPGQRVATAGPHAEVVAMPRHLCAHVPDSVPSDHAAFATVASIALHGIRLAELQLGEVAFVIGLGLVGQLAVALLRAAGVRVIATDLDPAKCALARRMGASHSEPGISAGRVEELTGGLGADAVVLAASTASSEPAHLAAAAVRKRGRIVLIGVVGLELDRRPFYFKECEFVVSCSYGPGRYDPDYEDRGHDYPASYVRWTEQRNIAAVLEVMAGGGLDVAPLISHRFDVADAERAYELIEGGGEPFLGVLLQYPDSGRAARERRVEIAPGPRRGGAIGYGVIGVGNYANSVLLPNLARLDGFRPVAISSAGGASAGNAARRHGFAWAVSEEQEVIQHPEVDAVFILTRHDSHARLAAAALRAGKHVFCEKPLCLTEQELGDVEDARSARPAPPVLMVGFNRRFSPSALRARAAFAGTDGPRVVTIRVNAGPIPASHWTQDEGEGGGRIVGEACHAVDLAAFLAGSPVRRAYAESVARPGVSDDDCLITLRHANGSISSICYTAAGAKALAKERVEVFAGGRVAVIDDFREVTTVDAKGSHRWRSGSQDKGHLAALAAFLEACRTGACEDLPWASIANTSLASLRAVESLRVGAPLDVMTEVP